MRPLAIRVGAADPAPPVRQRRPLEGERRRRYGGGPYFPRNSRRRILPTGVLGSSVRNSITLGRL